MHYPYISVIVCTLNRKSSLKKCLTELLNVDYPKSRYEIIVVDGGSVDGTVDMLKKEFPQVRCIIEERIGVSYARNRGIENANGNIIAFTDDDCIVTRNWLHELASSFSSADIGAVGGPVRFLHHIPPKILVKAALGGYDLGEKKEFVKFLITSNMAIKSEIARKIRFDTKLGRRGNMLFDNEDIDFCEKISRMGYRLLYNPKAVVYHDINLKRVNTRYILLRAIYSGISLYLMKKKYVKSRIKLFRDTARSTFGMFLLFLCKRKMENFYFFVRNLTFYLALFTSPFIDRKIKIYR